jgi:hypothetical protein
MLEESMPLISLSIAHGQTLEEARRRLETVVHEVSDRFGVGSAEWSADCSRVKLTGVGARVDMWVDAQEIHLTGDIPALGGLLSGPLTSGLKQIVHRTFRKQLP